MIKVSTCVETKFLTISSTRIYGTYYSEKYFARQSKTMHIASKDANLNLCDKGKHDMVYIYFLWLFCYLVATIS